MRYRLIFTGWLAITSVSAFADEGLQLAGVEKPPAGLSEPVLAMLETKGVQIAGKDSPICTIWLAKALPLKPNFKPTLNVKYPLMPGQLVGALEVQSESFTDFRGQPIKAGVYTLRYGQQPTDGNHVGTSELADFLLAVPAASDADPAPVKPATLFKRSAKATGSNHPAILSLLPAGEKTASPALEHDTAKELWTVQLAGSAAPAGSETVVPLKLVIIGKSEG